MSTYKILFSADHQVMAYKTDCTYCESLVIDGCEGCESVIWLSLRSGRTVDSIAVATIVSNISKDEFWMN